MGEKINKLKPLKTMKTTGINTLKNLYNVKTFAELIIELNKDLDRAYKDDNTEMIDEVQMDLNGIAEDLGLNIDDLYIYNMNAL